MRSKLGALAEALTGHFRAHHGYLLRMMLDRIDALGAQADQLTGRIEELLAPLPISPCGPPARPRPDAFA
jgi:hypothetical protein